MLTPAELSRLSKLARIGRRASFLLSSIHCSQCHKRELQDWQRLGQVARCRIAEANLRLVMKIASKYKGQSEWEDVVQEGNAGLMMAIDNYDERRGYRFSTYAVFWIRKAISEFITSDRTIRIPYIVSRHLVSPQPDRPRRYTPPQALLDKAEAAWNIDSLGMIGADNETLAEKIVDPHHSDISDLISLDEAKGTLRQAVADLPSDMQKVICLRYGLGQDQHPCNLKMICAACGIGLSVARDTERKALLTLRQNESLRAVFDSVVLPHSIPPAGYATASFVG
jgi:RNA polymerase primary sigma factor